MGSLTLIVGVILDHYCGTFVSEVELDEKESLSLSLILLIITTNGPALNIKEGT